MTQSKESSESRLRQIVRECVHRAVGADREVPGDEEDLVRSGALDSMAWVEVLESIEKATGVDDLRDPTEQGEPASILSLVAALERAPVRHHELTDRPGPVAPVLRAAPVAIAGWGAALGAARVDAAAVEREYGLPAGKLQEGAGIESVVRAAPQEDELSLALSASQAALNQAGADAADVDWILASSETFLGFPSLGAWLHSRLLARETCGVLDIGGACLGLLNSFAVAQSLLAAGTANRVLVVTADVHSRLLSPGRVVGEFGGLFGDGASAFVLRRLEETDASPPYRLGDFQFGCAGTFASAIVVGLTAEGKLALDFEGEALARAAVGRLEKIIADLEVRTGLSRKAASCFATHQPNPRLVALLARQADVPVEKFPVVSRTCGNLGSSTCGVALAKALEEHGTKSADERGPIFLAALGPGMLWGGGVLY